MFGRGAFTINRQEENNFLSASERSTSSQKPEWFSGYFTSKCVKKPAEGPRGFKKTCQKGILEHRSILAAICKNNSVCEKL